MNWLESRGLVVDRHASLLGDTATAVFSADRRYRYALTRRWDPDWPLVAWVMLNPSTADALADDPTIRRVISFSRSWRAGGVLVLNLFAWRATNPAELATVDDPVGPLNDQVIAWWWSVDCDETIGPVVAAWGAHKRLLGRDVRVTDLLRARHAHLVSLGVTKDGHPRHPLYVRGGTATIDYPPSVPQCASLDARGSAGTVAGSSVGLAGEPATTFEARVPAAADHAGGTAGTRSNSGRLP